MKDDQSFASVRWFPTDPRFQSLLKKIVASGSPVYIVGGAVRDALLHQIYGSGLEASRQETPAPENVATGNVAVGKPSDIDIALPAHACQIARRVADTEGWAFYKLDAERDIARLVYNSEEKPLICDIARFQGDSLRDDLAKRDFTVNAMAFELGDGWADSSVSGAESNRVALIDYHEGVRDLKNRQIRRVGEKSLLDDPVRLLRAVRFAAQLSIFGHFQIETETKKQIVENVEQLKQSSQERIRDELWKALAAPQPAEVVEALRLLGLLSIVLPEVADTVGVPQSYPHHLDVYHHTLAAVRHAGFLRDWILRDNRAGRNQSAGEVALDYRNGTASQQTMFKMLEPWYNSLQEHFCTNLATGHLRADWLVWLALFHDVGKPETRIEEVEGGVVRHRFFDHEHVGASKVAERLTVLHFSRNEVKLAMKAVDAHMRPHHLHASFGEKPISQRACYRYFRDVGRIPSEFPVGIDVILLALADMQAIHRELNFLSREEENVWGKSASNPRNSEISQHWVHYLQHAESLIAYGFGNKGDSAVRNNRLVTGHQLIEQLGMKPGPILGLILEQVAEAQAAGEIETEEEALDWVAKRLPELSHE